MKFMRKEFTTTDSNGCEFKALALYGDCNYNMTNRKFERNCDYYAFDKSIHAKSLKELKKKVSRL